MVILTITSNIKWKSLLINIAIPVSVGIISSLITGGGFDEYTESIIKPPLSPSPIIFPIVWTLLYILMGISTYLITQNNEIKENKALIIYAVQLAINFLWPVFFFGFGAYLFSFIWLILLIISVILMIILFYMQNKKAALLQIPYLIWLFFAAYLNFAVYLLN